tara:strand:+ start:936 stop:1145 length:210 start_codon:yes stop_codon:yes gene_type:complete
MEKENYKLGDLVLIDVNSSEDWAHLKEKGKDHPLRLRGVITEIREEDSIVVKFAGWTAYLKSSDLLKAS